MTFVPNLSKTNFKKMVTNEKKMTICPKRAEIKDESNEIVKQKRTGEGYALEKYALRYLGVNVLDVGSSDIRESLELTNKALKNKEKHIWQASVSGGGVFTTADLLTMSKTNPGHYDIIEIKSCGSVKGKELLDGAFQKIAFEEAGVKIDRVIILYINTSYVRNGDLDLGEFFRVAQLNDNKDYIKILKEIRDGIEFARDPENKSKKVPGAHCGKCPLLEECHGKMPEFNIFQMMSTGSKLDKHVKEGEFDLTTMSEPEKLTDNQSVVFFAARKNEKVINAPELVNAVKNLKYPITYLDYETISSAIPRFDNTKPFEQIPFQYTVQVEHEDGRYEKKNYIFKGEGDPRLDLAKNLERDIPSEGTIVVWWEGFEKGVNSALGKFLGKEDLYERYNSRIYDLMKPFQKRHYYTKEFKGSASIKYIIKALFPKESYAELDIQEGEMASILYENVLDGKIVGEERDKILSDLLIYCDADGENMKKIKDYIVGVLEELNLDVA